MEKLTEALTEAATDITESWGDLVDTTEFMTDTQGFFPGGSTSTFSQIYDRSDGRYRPVYQSESDLKLIRAMAWLIQERVPMAQSWVNRLNDYTIGTGFDWSVRHSVVAYERVCQSFVREFLDDSGWSLGLERESYEREVGDGEFLGELVASNRQVQMVTREPDELTEPANKRDLEDWLGVDDYAPSWSFGVLSDKRYPDIPKGYHFVRDPGGNDWDYVPSERVVHWKRNVRRRAKRGFSDFHRPHLYLLRADRVLTNTSEGAATQAAIAYIVEHTAVSTQSKADSVVSRLANMQQRVNPMTGLMERRRQMKPGTRLDVPAGQQYKAGLLGSNNSQVYIQVLESALRLAGSVHAFPEGMLTGSYQNANLASALVAEGPFIQGRLAEQLVRAEHVRLLIIKALRLAITSNFFARFGILSWEQFRGGLTVEVTPARIAPRNLKELTDSLNIQKANGWVSDKTAITELGRDIDVEVANGLKIGQQPGADPGAGGDLGLGGDGAVDPMTGQAIGSGGAPVSAPGASGAPGAAPASPDGAAASGGAPDWLGLTRVEWQRVRKNVVEVLNEFADGKIKKSVAKMLLSSLGINAEAASTLLLDASDGSVDSLGDEDLADDGGGADEGGDVSESLREAFCPTGKGGKIDNSCSSKKKGVGVSAGVYKSVSELGLENALGPSKEGIKNLGPLKVRGFRVGSVDTKGKKVYHFGGSASDVGSYQRLHQLSGSSDTEIKEYDLEFANAVLAGHQGDLTMAWFKKPYGEMMDSYQAKYGPKGASYATAMFDARLASEAKKRGYDGIVLINPAPPAEVELWDIKNDAPLKQAAKNQKAESPSVDSKEQDKAAPKPVVANPQVGDSVFDFTPTAFQNRKAIVATFPAGEAQKQADASFDLSKWDRGVYQLSGADYNVDAVAKIWKDPDSPSPSDGAPDGKYIAVRSIASRGWGSGTRLLKKIEAHAASRGAGVLLSATESSEPYWVKQGYKRGLGATYYKTLSDLTLSEAWDPAKHPNDPDGKYTRGGNAKKEKSLSSMLAWALRRFKNPEHAKAFTKWFGNSKVVDENGDPLRVFHGSADQFVAFDTSVNLDSSRDRAVFFSSNPVVASGYAGYEKLEHKKAKKAIFDLEDELENLRRDLGIRSQSTGILNELNDKLDTGEITRDQYDQYLGLSDRLHDLENAGGTIDYEFDTEGEGNPQVYPAYLRLENPLVIDADGDNWDYIVPHALETVDRSKHDGIIFKNIVDNPSEYTSAGPSTTYAVFAPSSVKSATGNRGTFDGSSDNIMEAFCATGKKGGRKNTCSSRRGSSHSAASGKRAAASDVPRAGSRVDALVKDAIEQWWQGGYEEINDGLRSGSGSEVGELLVYAIHRSEPSQSAQVAYRGISVEPNTPTYHAIRKGKGAKIVDDGISSITTNEKVAKNFSIGGDSGNDAYVMRVHMPKGTRSLKVDGSGLDERILAPGEFTIASVGKPGEHGVRVVDVVYNDPEAGA